MQEFILIIVTTLIISLASLIGVVFLIWKQEKIERFLLSLVALSAGTLAGGAFLHLLPEAVELFDNEMPFYIVLASFLFFFVIEKILHWRHCHKGHCDKHSFGYLNLIGDGIHNFIDGLIIAAAFVADLRLGFLTGLAISLHEIPQEIGDFGVLLYSGFNKKKALWLNFLVAFIAVLGGIVGYFLSMQITEMTKFLLPFAAGGFIYISMSDLIPELREEESLKKSLFYFVCFICGLAIMFLMKFL